MTRVTETVQIKGSLQRVFDLVTTTKYWTQWHPATLGVSGQVEQPLRLGDKVKERANIGGAEVEGTWTVTAYEPSRRLVLSMPATRLGNLSIEYLFDQKDGVVEFTRGLEYDLSALPTAQQTRIAEQMKSDSAIAVARIKQMVERPIEQENNPHIS